MPASSSPPWTPGTTGYRRHFRYGTGDVRASDAERAEIADKLSKHYQDGRLDQAEFNERLDRAMNAKTRADFSGLFADLPDLPEDGIQGQSSRMPAPPARRPRSGNKPVLGQLLTIAVIVVVAIIFAHTVMTSSVLWVLAAVLGFLWLRNEDRRRRH
jgi:Flp pilus assembly protein TadB